MGTVRRKIGAAVRERYGMVGFGIREQYWSGGMGSGVKRYGRKVADDALSDIFFKI